VRLGRAIVHQIFGGAREVEVVSLDPQLEGMLLQASQTRGGEGPGLEPGLAERLLRQAGQVAQMRDQIGQPAVLLVPPALRGLLSRFLRRAAPHLKVLSQSEIPDNRTVKVVALLGGAA
jgi:flagellar biosynthesis protein FlhA